MQIVHNEDTALSAIIADLRTKEMAVESTKRVWLFPLRQHGRRVVIWIGKHNAGSRARENELRHILCSEVRYSAISSSVRFDTSRTRSSVNTRSNS
jgi:hypothetical protein